MEHFFEGRHRLVWQQSLRLNKKARHLLLPAFVYFTLGHPASCAIEILSFQITNQQAVRSQEK